MMQNAAGASRRRVALGAGLAGIASAALAAVSLMPAAPARQRSEVGALVAPGLEARSADLRLIMVTTSEEVYHLVREGEDWVLPEKGGYRVRPERIGEMVRALTSLRYARPMTRDERKFDRIGLGDPTQGGTGALVEAGNGQGDVFAKLIVGYRRGSSYVRDPDDLQGWAATGEEMPPLQRGARWLDLEVVELDPADIAEVRVRPAGSPGYVLNPADASGAQFKLAPPLDARPLAASFAPNLPALALSRLSPSDVAAEKEIVGAAAAGDHVTRTRQGLEITARAWLSDERGWLTLSAAGNGSEAVNARTAGWAFALTETDWGSFVMPLAAIVDPE